MRYMVMPDLLKNNQKRVRHLAIPRPLSGSGGLALAYYKVYFLFITV
jgi:hypothetical protein